MPWIPRNDGRGFEGKGSIDLARDDFADDSYERARARQGKLPYVPEDAEVRFEHPFEELGDAELTFFALHRGIGDFSTFVSTAYFTYGAAAKAPKRAKEKHKTEPANDQERSDFVAGIFDNTQRLLRMVAGNFGSFCAETAFQIQRWAIDGNKIILDINEGWIDHLCTVSWGPHWAKVDVHSHFDGSAVGYQLTPRKPHPAAWVKQHVERIDIAIDAWRSRADALQHRVAVCAQAHHATLTSSLAPSAHSKAPLPATWFREHYQLEPDALRKARDDGRIRRAVRRPGPKGKGCRWFYFEDEICAVWPDRAKPTPHSNGKARLPTGQNGK